MEKRRRLVKMRLSEDVPPEENITGTTDTETPERRIQQVSMLVHNTPNNNIIASDHPQNDIVRSDHEGSSMDVNNEDPMDQASEKRRGPTILPDIWNQPKMGCSME